MKKNKFILIVLAIVTMFVGCPAETDLSMVGNDNTTTTNEQQKTDTQHTIVYSNLNGNGTAVMSVFSENENVILQELSRTGYTFRGWYDGTADTAQKVESWTAGTHKDNVVLWAKWEPIKVSVALANDSDIQLINAFYDDYLPNVTVPTKEGYSFAGYYTGKDRSGIRYIDSEGQGCRILRVTETIALYAGWNEKSSSDNHDAGLDGNISNLPNDQSILNNCIYLGESDETVDGVVYTVKSYAEIHADCAYLYEYYRLYYHNNVLRRIVFVYHELMFGSGKMDYTYMEIEKHYKEYNYRMYIYYDNGCRELQDYSENGELSGIVSFYESGNRKMQLTTNSYNSLNQRFLSIDYYKDNENHSRKAHISYNMPDEKIDSFYYLYDSSYYQYYYSSGYLYTYEDGVTTYGEDSRYSSKTEYTDEQALAKFEELIGEQIPYIK